MIEVKESRDKMGKIFKNIKKVSDTEMVDLIDEFFIKEATTLKELNRIKRATKGSAIVNGGVCENINKTKVLVSNTRNFPLLGWLQDFIYGVVSFGLLASEIYISDSEVEFVYSYKNLMGTKTVKKGVEKRIQKRKIELGL